MKLLWVILKFAISLVQTRVWDLFKLIEVVESVPPQANVNQIEEDGQHFKREEDALKLHSESERDGDENYVVNRCQRNTESHSEVEAETLVQKAFFLFLVNTDANVLIYVRIYYGTFSFLEAQHSLPFAL